MKKRTGFIIAMSALFALALSTTAFAKPSDLVGDWVKDANGWKFIHPTSMEEVNTATGVAYVNEWMWLDANCDKVCEAYYFGPDGYLLTNTTTPDGYTVNADGQWTENGVVQTREGRGYGWMKAKDGYFVWGGKEYKTDNGGYDEHGVSKAAIDMKSNTMAENEAKYGLLPNQELYGSGRARKYYRNGIWIDYSNKWTGSDDASAYAVELGFYNNSNDTERGKQLFKDFEYLGSGTDEKLDKEQQRLKGLGYDAKRAGGMVYIDFMADDGNWRSVEIDGYNATL